MKPSEDDLNKISDTVRALQGCRTMIHETSSVIARASRMIAEKLPRQEDGTRIAVFTDVTGRGI